MEYEKMWSCQALLLFCNYIIVLLPDGSSSKQQPNILYFHTTVVLENSYQLFVSLNGMDSSYS
jgi:hypothetical protein